MTLAIAALALTAVYVACCVAHDRRRASEIAHRRMMWAREDARREAFRARLKA